MEIEPYTDDTSCEVDSMSRVLEWSTYPELQYHIASQESKSNHPRQLFPDFKAYVCSLHHVVYVVEGYVVYVVEGLTNGSERK